MRRSHTLSWILVLLVLGGGSALACDTGSNQPQPGVPGTQYEALRALRDDEIVGTLPPVPSTGPVSGLVHYSNPPIYRALSFTAVAQHRYRATVTSTSGSHAAVWIAKRDGTTLDQGADQAEATIDVDGTYYVVLRDVAFVSGDFMVAIEEIAAVADAGADTGSPVPDATADAAPDASTGTGFVIPPALENVPIVVDLACKATAYLATPTPPPPETRYFAETITLRLLSAPEPVTYSPGGWQGLYPRLFTQPTSKVRIESSTGPDVPVSFPAAFAVTPNWPDTQNGCPRLPNALDFQTDSAACRYAIGAPCPHERRTCRYLSYGQHVQYNVTETAGSYKYESVMPTDTALLCDDLGWCIMSLASSPLEAVTVTIVGGKVHVELAGLEQHGSGSGGTTEVTCTGQQN